MTTVSLTLRPLLRPVVIGLVVMLALPGCSGWWGVSDSKTPLSGERLAVLATDQQIQAEPEAAKTPLTLPPAANVAEWPTAGGAPDHAGGHYALGTALKKAWDEDAGEGVERDKPLIPTPVVSGGVVFAMDSAARVTAFSADKGKKLWRVDLRPKAERGDATGGGLAVAGGQVFCATGYGEVAALQAADGHVVWRVNVKSPLRSAPAPAPASGLVMVVTIDNRVLALSASTGEVQWKHAGLAESAGLLGAPSPAVAGESTLVAYSSGELFALRTVNGREQWSDTLSSLRREGGAMSLAAIRGQPVLAEGGQLALAVSNAGYLAAIDVRTGQRVWDRRLNGNQMPWVAGNAVFVVTAGGQLLGLNLSDGRVRWVNSLGLWQHAKKKEGLIVWYGPVLAGGQLWLTSSEGRLRAFDPLTGQQKADYRLGESTNRPPIVAGGLLFTLDDDAELTAWR